MEKNNTIAEAPEHIKLAIDLIMLLEQESIDPQIVLDALEVVKRDFEKKL